MLSQQAVEVLEQLEHAQNRLMVWMVVGFAIGFLMGFILAWSTTR